MDIAENRTCTYELNFLDLHNISVHIIIRDTMHRPEIKHEKCLQSNLITSLGIESWLRVLWQWAVKMNINELKLIKILVKSIIGSWKWNLLTPTYYVIAGSCIEMKESKTDKLYKNDPCVQF